MFSRIFEFLSPKYVGLYLFLISLVLSSTLTSAVSNFLHRENQAATVIHTTGLAVRDVKSDLAQWDLSIERESPNVQESYKLLSQDNNKIIDFLTAQKISKDAITGPNFSTEKQDITETTSSDKNSNLSPDTTDTSSSSMTTKVVGQKYVTKAYYQIKSNEVQKISQASTELIGFMAENNIVLDANNLSYIYTGLENLKLELLKEASDNSRKRAENIASSTNMKVTKLLSADQGIFQINRKGDNEVSYEGVYDTTAIDKTVRGTINTSFLMGN